MRFIVLALVFALAQQPPDPQQQERARAEAAAKRTAERLRALQREADQLATREKTLLTELQKLEVDRRIRIEQLGQIERDLADTKAKLADAHARAETLKKTADTQRPDVEARLVQLYKMGSAGYWRLLLDVDDLRSMGRAYRTAAAMTSIDRARIEEHQKTLEALAAERGALERRSRELAALQSEAVRARQAADRAVAARNALVEQIDARRDLNAQLTGELQDAQQRLQSSIAQLNAGKGAGAVSLPLRPFQGELPWPARGTVSRRFGRQASSRFGTAIVRNGMEIEVPDGEPVRAVHEGTVAFADQFTGYGNLVIVEHGDRSYSLYGYLSSLDVTRGQRVEAHSQLGTSGRNPSGNPALYFELRIDGAAVDPLQWLKK